MLDIRLYQAVGLLEMLWHLTDREAPRGDIGKLSDEAICDSLDWPGSPPALIDALAECGWLDRCEDHRLVVHDWQDHCTDALRKKIARDGTGFAGVRRCPPMSADVRRNLPPSHASPLPLPSPATPPPRPPAVAAAAEAESAMVPVSSIIAATTAQEQQEIDPRLSDLMSIGMVWGKAGGLLRRFKPTVEEVENYVARSHAPNVNNRIGFVMRAIEEKWPIEPIGPTADARNQADEDKAMREGIEDSRRRLAAKGKQ